MATQLSRLPKLTLLLGILTVSAGCAAQDTRAQRDYPPNVMFQNYALSACLSDASGDPSTKADAAAAAAGYLELGEGPLEAYTEAAELGRTFLARRYQGSTGAAYNTMKCIDLYHSDELRALTRKYFGHSR